MITNKIKGIPILNMTDGNATRPLSLTTDGLNPINQNNPKSKPPNNRPCKKETINASGLLNGTLPAINLFRPFTAM